MAGCWEGSDTSIPIILTFWSPPPLDGRVSGKSGANTSIVRGSRSTTMMMPHWLDCCCREEGSWVHPWGDRERRGRAGKDSNCSLHCRRRSSLPPTEPGKERRNQHKSSASSLLPSLLIHFYLRMGSASQREKKKRTICI